MGTGPPPRRGATCHACQQLQAPPPHRHPAKPQAAQLAGHPLCPVAPPSLWAARDGSAIVGAVGVGPLQHRGLHWASHHPPLHYMLGQQCLLQVQHWQRRGHAAGAGCGYLARRRPAWVGAPTPNQLLAKCQQGVVPAIAPHGGQSMSAPRCAGPAGATVSAAAPRGLRALPPTPAVPPPMGRGEVGPPPMAHGGAGLTVRCAAPTAAAAPIVAATPIAARFVVAATPPAARSAAKSAMRLRFRAPRVRAGQPCLRG